MTKKIKYVEPAEYFPEEFYEQARKEYEEMKKKEQISEEDIEGECGGIQ